MSVGTALAGSGTTRPALHHDDLDRTGSVALGAMSAGMLKRQIRPTDAAVAKPRVSPAPQDEDAIARSDVVDEHVHLRRRSWDVRIGVEVGDTLLGEHVLAQERVAGAIAAWAGDDRIGGVGV